MQSMGSMQRGSRTSGVRKARRDWKDLLKISTLAISEGDYATVKRIITKQPGILQAHTSHTLGLLSLAAAKGDEAIVQLLLDHGADITQRDAVGATPLIHSAAEGHTAVIQQLISSNAVVLLGRQVLLQQATKRGETAVMAAAKRGHMETLKFLVASGASLATINQEGSSALHLACKHNQPSIVQYLRQQCHCSCNESDSQGRTPLMVAAAAAAADTVQLLLQNRQQWGLQLNAVDAAGNTVLVHAVRADDTEVLEMLVAAGLTLKAKWPQDLSWSCWCIDSGCPSPGRNGLTLASLQVQQQEYTAVDKAVHRLQSPQQCSIPSTMSPTAAAGSSTGSGTSSVGYLDGGDALMYVAAASGSVAVIDWLLKQGIGMACVDAADEHSAVFAAVKFGQTGSLHCLVQQTGCSLEPRDYRGRTPLMWAAAAGQDRMIRLLVHLGADLLAQDLGGLVARQVANNDGTRATAEVLTQLAREQLS